MKIFIKAKPNAKETRVEKIDGAHFAVWVKESPAEGQANRAIEKAVGEYLRVPSARVSIVSGRSARSKVAEILEI